MTRIPTATALLLRPLTIVYGFIVNWKNSVYDSGSAKRKAIERDGHQCWKFDDRWNGKDADGVVVG